MNDSFVHDKNVNRGQHTTAENWARGEWNHFGKSDERQKYAEKQQIRRGKIQREALCSCSSGNLGSRITVFSRKQADPFVSTYWGNSAPK